MFLKSSKIFNEKNSGSSLSIIAKGIDFAGEINTEGNIKGKFNIKNLHIKKNGLLQGKAKYEIIVVDAGGNIQGELGLIKQSKSNKNSKEKENNYSSNSNNLNTIK